MDKELLSIKQFAEAVGQTQQAIYRQLNKRLKNYVVLESGKKYIKAEAVGMYTEQELNNNSSVEQAFNNELNGAERLIETQKQQIEMLQSEIEAKNNQIQALQEQLKDITAALKASQSIQALYIQQIEDKQQQQKKGLFARIFGNKKQQQE